jgi:hypothetical protein
VSPSNFTVTAAWQPSVLSLPFDQYLAARGVPYVPFNSTCAQCYAQAVAQVNAITAAQTQYTNYQTAQIDKQAAVGQTAVAVGEAILALTVPEVGIGETIVQLTGDESFALLANSLVGQAKTVATLLVGGASTAALKDLGIADVALIGKATALLPGLSGGVGKILSGVIDTLENLNSILANASSYEDAVNNANAASAGFFPLFDVYQSERLAYQSCLNQYCGGSPSLPPPRYRELPL